MNAEERIKMVKAMEYITRQINDEEVFEIWLISGVADGDIEYGDLSVKAGDEEEFGTYIEDEDFGDLMQTFLRVMRAAYTVSALTGAMKSAGVPKASSLPLSQEAL